MKSYGYLFAVFFSFANMLLPAQSITLTESLVSSLGGVAVDFEITSDGENIGARNLYLIKRQTFHTWSNAAVNYETWHLSFSADYGFLKVQNRGDFRIAPVADYRLDFYNGAGRLIGTKFLNKREVVFALDEEGGNYFYCDINLRTVPLAILHDAARIDIIRRHSWRLLDEH